MSGDKSPEPAKSPAPAYVDLGSVALGGNPACEECGALLPWNPEYRTRHADWHQRMSREKEPMPIPLAPALMRCPECEMYFDAAHEHVCTWEDVSSS